MFLPGKDTKAVVPFLERDGNLPTNGDVLTKDALRAVMGKLPFFRRFPGKDRFHVVIITTNKTFDVQNFDRHALRQ